ncbi:MAG: phage portal protein, partial [Candidatus Peribacteraceae bacterium]|nr:phage portal protein [Candidatus Peribacteraceae bacterium]
WDLSFIMMKHMYKQCGPLADAIDTIAKDFAAITPVVADSATGEHVENHPILDLLAYPNDAQCYVDFAIEVASTFLLMGNTALRSVGNVKAPPLKLYNASPVYAQLLPSSTGSLGFVNYFTPWISEQYSENIVMNRSRYYTTRGDMEYWPISRYNPDAGGSIFWGQSKIQSLYYPIEQYVQSGIHNKSLLSNGARPSGMFSTLNEQPLGDDQFKRMQDQLIAYFTGPQNAGRPLLLENTDYKDMIVNNRDMDYESMIANVKNEIYQRYDIPLPTVNTGSMTLNNYATAQVALYDEAVLPVTDFLFKQMTLALMPRYGKDGRRYHITYDETEIGALRARRIEDAKQKKTVGVNSVNELRVELGDEEIEGGDVVLIPANVIPLIDLDERDQMDNNSVDSNGDRLFEE